MKSPLAYYGGKVKLAPKILKLFPPHTEYVEPFAGGLSLLFAKDPARVETVNDIDGGVVNFYRVLRNAETFDRLRTRLELTPYSREEFEDGRSTWERETDAVEKAVKWFVMVNMSFSSAPDAHSFKIATLGTRTGISEEVSKYLSKLKRLPEIHARLQTVQIEHRDFRAVLNYHNAPSTLAYCDPPYVWSTRKAHRYLFDMRDLDHHELLKILLDYKGMVVLSGYRNAIYADLDRAGWDRTDFEVYCDAVGRTKATGNIGPGAMLKHKRIESVWRNPRAVEACR